MKGKVLLAVKETISSQCESHGVHGVIVGELTEGQEDEFPTAGEQHEVSWDLKGFKHPQCIRAALLLMGPLRLLYIMLKTPIN